jgi:hypothetical protein
MSMTWDRGMEWAVEESMLNYWEREISGKRPRSLSAVWDYKKTPFS